MNPARKNSFLKKAFSYTRNMLLLGECCRQYWNYFFSDRRFPREQEFYVVYTSTDDAIPFLPDTARAYWLINFEFISTATRLGEILPRRDFDAIRDAYVEIAREGHACFREAPTVVPQFAEHNGRALRAANTLLKPVNCCPSLHTAAPLYFYHLGAHYFPETEPKLRRYIGDIVSTIIRTKLHALIDIAFGLLLSKKAVNQRLGLEFNDLESFFTREQKSQDNIPYEEIYRMYREINELARTQPGGDGNLPKLMKRYFQEMGLPLVTLEKSNCLYHLEQKKLIYPKGFTVGTGLF